MLSFEEPLFAFLIPQWLCNGSAYLCPLLLWIKGRNFRSPFRALLIPANTMKRNFKNQYLIFTWMNFQFISSNPVGTNYFYICLRRCLAYCKFWAWFRPIVRELFHKRAIRERFKIETLKEIVFLRVFGFCKTIFNELINE